MSLKYTLGHKHMHADYFIIVYAYIDVYGCLNQCEDNFFFF